MNQRKFFPDVAPEFGAILYRPLIEGIVVLKMSDLLIIVDLGVSYSKLDALGLFYLGLEDSHSC